MSSSYHPPLHHRSRRLVSLTLALAILLTLLAISPSPVTAATPALSDNGPATPPQLRRRSASGAKKHVPGLGPFGSFTDALPAVRTFLPEERMVAAAETAELSEREEAVPTVPEKRAEQQTRQEQRQEGVRITKRSEQGIARLSQRGLDDEDDDGVAHLIARKKLRTVEREQRAREVEEEEEEDDYDSRDAEEPEGTRYSV